jgi:putative membrane protein
MRLIFNFIISALIVMFLANFLPGVEVRDFTTSIIVVLVLSICNAIVKPILLLLTLPITILTLGLFLLVINVVMIYITDALVPGFQVNGFFSALIFSLLLSFLNSFSSKLLEQKED